jgi:hypothetical protein
MIATKQHKKSRRYSHRRDLSNLKLCAYKEYGLLM